MDRKISSADGLNRMRSQISIWFDEIKSKDMAIRRKAITGIGDIVTPNLLLDGYGQTKQLMRVAESPFPEEVIAPLIDLLRDSTTGDKNLILDTLFDLARYERVTNDFIPEDKLESYLSWAKHLRNLVYQGIEVYRNLSNSKEPRVAEMASDLIQLFRII